jgi:CRISPR type III-A-associated RAMP protein Csm4
MSPGLAVKLRPAGPWRIGPDSGARNRVDAIYHSDSLYSAVTFAMARMGSLDEWLDATARCERSAVSFSSCFPFVEELGFVVPPRTIWPPASPALMSARVRWKSARFVPLGIVQAILAGQTLDENHWAVDGPSGCLMPAGRPGPFRTSIRWSAAVDRLSGAAERHSVACTEFRSGAGLWTLASFADEAARDRWQEPVKASFRWLADSGFGGERSRGWGRAEAPEFVEGTLPEMILGVGGRGSGVGEAGAGEVGAGGRGPRAGEDAAAGGAEASEPPVADAELEPPARSPDPRPVPPNLQLPQPHWLLSLFTPAQSDAVDWERGSYSLLTRGGRIESPAGSGELKKQVQMVAEGSVLFAASAPRGAAPDVAPDGFAHPVFRAGFAVSIPLPEVS